MLNETTKITFDGIREAAAAGESIIIIVNGQYYDLDTRTPAVADPESAFIEGVKFAAAAINDRRARAFHVWQGIHQTRRATKKEQATERELNSETKSIIDFLLYIIKPEANLKKWKEDYQHGKLWKL